MHTKSAESPAGRIPGQEVLLAVVWFENPRF